MPPFEVGFMDLGPVITKKKSGRASGFMSSNIFPGMPDGGRPLRDPEDLFPDGVQF